MLTSKNKNHILKIFWDGVVLLFSFWVIYLIKYHTFKITTDYLHYLIALMLCWLISTVVTQKFKIRENRSESYPQKQLVLSLFILAGSISLYSMVIKEYDYSRFVIFGSLGLFYLLEVMLLSGKYFAPLFFKSDKKFKQRRSFTFLVFEFILLIVVFNIIFYINNITFNIGEENIVLLSGLYFIIVFVGLIFHQYDIKSHENYITAIWPFLKSIFVVIFAISIFSLFLKFTEYSSRMILATISLFYLIEILIVSVYYIFTKPKTTDEPGVNIFHAPLISDVSDLIYDTDIERVTQKKYIYIDNWLKDVSIKEKLKKMYLNECPKVFSFLDKVIELNSFNFNETEIIRSADPYNVQVLPNNSLSLFMNLHEINDLRRINEYIITVNSKLKKGGVFVGRFFPLEYRHDSIYSKYPKSLAGIIYIFDFIWKRLFPKLPVTQKIYFALTKGKNRVMSKAQGLGRLYYCGFESIGITVIDNCLYFVMKKVKEPCMDENPSYGPLFKMKRYGKEGKLIYVYKFRTMHPYSEYLQDYMIKLYGYGENGKPADDFRVTQWGKFLRKHWLDELPQLLNVLKGDMRLVGIRPLSNKFLEEYPEDIIRKRFKYKPGCVPPYVALRKQSVEEYIESERQYLIEKEKHPYWTDIKYFVWALYNIFTNKIRSA